MVLSIVGSPVTSLVPGRVRKSLVTPRTGGRRRVAIPIRRVPVVSSDLGRLPALAFTPYWEESPMARRRRRAPRPITTPILHPHAAGIDIGATEIYVCVPLDRDSQPIRRFGTFTSWPWPRGSGSAA